MSLISSWSLFIVILHYLKWELEVRFLMDREIVEFHLNFSKYF